MRIIHFIESLRSGGKERQLVELLKGLVNTPGIENELIVMSDDIHYSYIDELGIPIHRLLRKSRRDPSVFLRLYQLLKKREPDILHSWGAMCSIYALPSSKLLPIKFINGFLRSAPPSLSIRNMGWRRAKLTFPFSHAIVANSQAGLDAYQAPPHKSFCIHNGFDFTRIKNLPEKETIRKKYNIKSRYIVGMVATFSPNKDYATFFRAALKILANRADITFVMIGDGSTRASLQSQIPHEFHEKFCFLGRLKQVEEVINLFNIGVLATYTEGISNTIMEYMALAKPVIATNCGGNQEIVINGVTGFLVPCADADTLAINISILLDNEDLAREFGQAGQQRLHENFSLEQLTQKHIALYNKLLY